LVEINGQSIIQSFHRDISERKKLQAQLLHSQKMESIGQLASGIAHDFNNMLTGVLGFAELTLQEENLPDGVLQKVKRIEQGARQGKQMVSKLMSFARRENLDRVLFNANSVITDTLEMVARLIPRDIRIHKDLLTEGPVVEGDVSQMEQVLMNLVLNARDAMPKGGDLTIRSSIVAMGTRDLRIAANITPGKYVEIAVSDTGHGIADEHLHRIFEPFFTTKDRGKGTGLGLAMVYGIVKEHRGYITVESKINRGTTFKVYLPLSSRKLGVDSKQAALEWVHGSETILVVDDEVSVLEYIREALNRRGFNVLTTDNPVNALSLYRTRQGRIDLVITDILMPLMSGTDLINELRSINPQIRVIATTGLNLDIGEVRVDGFIKKPITTNALLSEVCKTLGYSQRTGNQA
jgi:nitrogen-specific signal transduction histidine kinase/CheY-like chemotaxis protein